MASTGEHTVSDTDGDKRLFSDPVQEPGALRVGQGGDQGEGSPSSAGELVELFTHLGKNKPADKINWIELSAETEQFGLALVSSALWEDNGEGKTPVRYYWRVLQPLHKRRHPEHRLSELVINSGVELSLEEAIQAMVQAAAKICNMTWNEAVNYIGEHRAMQFLTKKEQFWSPSKYDEETVETDE